MPRNETLHTREGIVVKEGDIAGEDVQEGTWVPLTVRLKTTRRLPQPERLRVPQAISKSHSGPYGKSIRIKLFESLRSSSWSSSIF
ncbi:hypothetical protein F8388_010814 [Cannabis sativa]|uniref:Uncharacterized protein n=1 Tax=Cannabis sativa TaxID=3483 RepID=A0A7J6HD31_CANSA|nr:hypothetical protein F8388_010814 [Cannabis sativa]